MSKPNATGPAEPRNEASKGRPSPRAGRDGRGRAETPETAGRPPEALKQLRARGQRK